MLKLQYIHWTDSTAIKMTTTWGSQLDWAADKIGTSRLTELRIYCQPIKDFSKEEYVFKCSGKVVKEICSPPWTRA